MCRAVAEAVATGTHLVVQAGTGTGKSLAYLVPAALSGKKVVIATATKALQDQLAEKDLPQVDAGLGLPAPLDFAVLKGRSNYVCRQRVAEVGSGGIQAELGDQGAGRADEPEPLQRRGERRRPGAGGDAPPEGIVEEVRQLVAWSQTSQTGDRADLSFEPSDRAWNMVSVGPRECPGAYNCPSGGRCFAEAARERASVADIVVVNTHLYGAHLASGGVVLPEHDVVIFDEAHELEEVMTSSLGVEVTPGRFRSLVTSARSLVEPRDADLLDSARRRSVTNSARCSAIGSGRASCTTSAGRRSTTASWPSCSLAAAEVSRRVTDALRRGGRAALVPGRGRRGPNRTPTAPAARRARCRLPCTWRRTCTGSRRAATARSPGSTGRAATSGCASPPSTSVPCSRPCSGARSHPCLTSATIPPRVVERVGLGGVPHRRAQRGEPLRLPRRTRCSTWRATCPIAARPERRRRCTRSWPSCWRRPADGPWPCSPASGRREAAAAALAPELPYTVLLQGDLPKSRLLEAFASDETSCLFATMGFWQGVDIPGRALSLVTIDKLPFPRPDDPLLQARRDRAGGRAFSLVDLPRAATLLAQGSGRLIRTCRGSGGGRRPRLRGWPRRRYRGVLLATLPPMRRSVDIHEVEAFLRRALEGETETA